jgi:Transposase DDE domain
MQSKSLPLRLPEACSGYSIVLVERILRQAQALGLNAAWAALPLGQPSRRATAYRPEQRVAALLAGLAAGLKGIAPGNDWLRPNAALQARLGGRFPDQGTIHRWLGAATGEQAAAFRDHLHRVVAAHGCFWDVLHSSQLLVVDIDGQGLVARGRRFERAALGYLGEGLDTGYQRYVCYAADTGEVLDEFLAPGNCTLMSQLPELLAGLGAVIPRGYRDRVVLRMDAHGGTINNLREVRRQGYHYVCPPQSWATVKRLREHLQGRRGGWFEEADSTGQIRRVQFWVIPRWKLSGKGRGRKLYTRATVYRERHADGQREWLVLLSDLKREKGQRLWRRYHGRGGAIEEYNDQAERAYHLEVVRTGHFAGLQVVHALVGLCWNLTHWASASLRLPPLEAPQAEPARWEEASRLDLAGVQERAAHSGLRLYRARPGAVLEVEDTAGTPESAAWCRWLEQPTQLRLRLTG